MKNIDFIDLTDCVIKDEYGTHLARLVEDGDFVRVEPFECCSIGMYFHILWYLSELGWKVK